MTFSNLAPALVGLLVVLAGCAAVPGTDALLDDGPSDDDADLPASPTAEPTRAPSGPATGNYVPFDFAGPGRYVYDVSNEYDGEGVFAFDVRSTARSAMEIEIDWTIGGATHREVLSGTDREVTDDILAVHELDSHGMMWAAVYAPGAWTLGRTLTVGDSWGATVDGDDGLLSVTGTAIVGDVACYTLEFVVEGQVRYEGCLSPDHGFPMQSVYYDETGAVTLSMELRSYAPAG